MLRGTFFVNKICSNLQLTERNEKSLQFIELALKSNLPHDIEFIIKHLTGYSYENLTRMYNNSAMFRDFCNNNTVFQEAMENQLKKAGYIGIGLISMDGKDKLSLFDVYIAVKIFTEYYRSLEIEKSNIAERKKGIEALNCACELGLFNALIARVRNSINKIYRISSSDAFDQDIMEPIFQDTQKLSNLYWSVGYVQTGFLLIDAANAFLTIESEKDRGMLITEEGLKYLVAGSLIEDYPESKRIRNWFNENKKMEQAEQRNPVDNWEEAKLKIFSLAGSHANYERILNGAKQMVKPILDEQKNRPSP